MTDENNSTSNTHLQITKRIDKIKKEKEEGVFKVVHTLRKPISVIKDF